MRDRSYTPVVRRLRKLAGLGVAADTTDRQLLERYVHRGEEEAFTQLVERHGGLVRGVCRRVLRHEQDADDAFQATFVVLARKANSVRWRESVGPWLHTVAYRVAQKARTQTARQPATTTEHLEESGRDPLAEVTWRELRTVLDKELQCLPEKYRAPLVLCYLEGKTRDEAAQELGWSTGVLRGRLERGRDRLRGRLVRRGVALSGALLGTALSETTTSAQVSTTFVAATVATAHRIAAASPQVAMLARYGSRALLASRLKLAAGVILAVTAFAAGVVLLCSPGPDGPPRAVSPEHHPAVADGPSAPAPRAAAGDPLPQGALVRMGTTRFHQGSPVSGIAYAPDGKLLATGGNWHEGNDRVVHLWGATSGQELRRLEGHESSVTAVAFAPDGRTLASGSRDRTVRIWDLAAGIEVRRLDNHDAEIFALAFSPDGKRLAVITGDDPYVWDALTGKELHRLRGHEGQTSCVAFSLDGKLIAAGGQDQKIHLWDTATGQEKAAFAGNQGWIVGLAFAPDGKFLASAGSERTPRLWDLNTLRPVRRFEPDKEANAGYSPKLAFAPDGKMLFAVGNRRINRWEVATGEQLPPLESKAGSVTNVIAVSPDGKWLAAGGQDQVIRLWNLSTSKELQGGDGHDGTVSFVAFLHGRKQLISAGWDGTVRLWDANTGKQVRTLVSQKGPIHSVAITPDGTVLAWPGPRGSPGQPRWPPQAIQLFDLATEKPLREQHASPNGCTSLAFSPDGKLLARTGARGAIELCPRDRDETVRLLADWKGAAYSVTFSPDGKLVAAGCADRTARVWEVATGADVHRFPIEAEAVLAVAFSPDGKVLAGTGGIVPTGGGDHTIYLWDLATARERARLKGDQYEVTTLAFAPDGKLLASGGLDGRIRLWDPGTGKERRQFRGHTGTVKSLAFSLDGRRLASASSDSTILVWDVTGQR